MVIRDNEGYGVAIEFDDIRDISENLPIADCFPELLQLAV